MISRIVTRNLTGFHYVRILKYSFQIDKYRFSLLKLLILSIFNPFVFIKRIFLRKLSYRYISQSNWQLKTQNICVNTLTLPNQCPTAGSLSFAYLPSACQKHPHGSLIYALFNWHILFFWQSLSQLNSELQNSVSPIFSAVCCSNPVTNSLRNSCEKSVPSSSGGEGSTCLPERKPHH